jgi:phage-Barnase-EndoU-ColicinE5/D-RelE like nuclease2/Phage Mu protein F like protein
VTARHYERRIEAIRTAITATDFETAARNLLELAASWTPNHLGTMLSHALELAALEGREAVYQDAETLSEFAEPKFGDHSFKEQIAFLRQKRAKPTKAWTDAMHGDHDRAFVVAGANDQALVDEFQTAILKAAETYDIRGFAKDFDRLVEKYGWDYKGGRNWRIRTIFETNLRTSHMAGRLAQMRDPDVVKNRPYWKYVHADLRVPLNPRLQHLSWDGLVLMHDDPFWDTHFPPNDWGCSCGMVTLSKDDLKRMGKSGPDPSPKIVMKPFHHKASGTSVMLPDGIGFGWDYQPGNLWERGLVPSALIDEAGGLISTGRHAAAIDTPEPVTELIAGARPFKAKPMATGLDDEAYVRGFLEPFGADIGAAVLFEDKTGQRVPISDAFFRDRAGAWKVGKRDRAILTPLLAETLMDPDEIWIGLARKGDELLVDRRYVRVDKNSGLMVVFEVGRKFWEAITAYPMTNRKGHFDTNTLRNRRGGKLLYKRKKRQG